VYEKLCASKNRKNDKPRLSSITFYLRYAEFRKYNYPFSLLAKTDISFDWRRVCDEIRTYFRQKLSI
jgi:hypothetical protein